MITTDALEDVVAQLPMPAWLIDADGSVRPANAAAKAAAVAGAGGGPPRDLDGLATMWRHPDGSPLEPPDTPFHRCLDSGEPVEALLRPAAAERTQRLVVVARRDDNGRTCGALALAERDGEASLADWLGDVGHALRSPLSPIRTAAQLMRNPRIDAQQRDGLLDIVERQIRELMTRIDELSDLVRVKRGLLSSERRPCELSMLVDVARGRVATKIEEEGRELGTCEVPLDVAVLVDQMQVVQALSLVLLHALRGTPPGARIDCEVAVEGDSAHVVVRDHDRRAGPERASELLEPPSERHGVGIGAALYLARVFIEHSGGCMHIAPRPQTGADAPAGMEFRIELPCVRTTAEG